MTYQSTVLADSPTFLWLLNETSGTTAADASGNGNAGAYTGGCTLGLSAPSGVTTRAGALARSTGHILNYFGSFQTNVSAEVWFNTTSANGGALLFYWLSFGAY